jgi:hypothetical protein
MPCRLAFPEWYERSAAIRSIASRVPSRMTNALCRTASIAWLREGARSARTSTASRM